jgi:DNA-binding winged helix-turn-helix (wHTH) protein/tetratricopeptide (TPR) repeat protein
MTASITYRFGDFRLHTATRSLRRGAEPVSLPPKVFDCVTYLIQHRERAVGRDELTAAVWGRVDVGDGVLGQTILQARKALDDTGREQQIIRTVPRFGYHWLAAVEVDEADAAAPPPTVPTATRARLLRPPRRPLLAALAAAVLAGATALAWLPRPSTPDDAVVTSVAAAPANVALVLPVTVVGADEAGWIRFGVMDLIAGRLRAAGQDVVPSDNVVALARACERAAVDPAERAALAAATGAALMIQTRAQALDGRWQVTLQVVHGAALPAAVGEGTDVLTAARSAGDRLAASLGLAPVRDERSDDPLPQQIEAALLEDRTDHALALLEQVPASRREQPLLRFQRARAQFQNGEFDAARETLNRLAAEVSPSVDAVLHARALNALAGIELQLDRPAAALPGLDRAIELLARERAYGQLGKACNNRAAAHGALHEHAAAQADLAQARIALATAGDALGLAILDSNAGAAAVARDRFAEAVPILTGAIGRFATFRAPAVELNARANLADAQLALLDPAAALGHEARMRDLTEQVGDPVRRRAADLVRIEVLSANGHLRDAAALLRQVRHAAQAQADTTALARAQAIAARIALDAGDAALAEREAGAALGAAAPVLDTRQAAAVRWLRIRALAALGRGADADDALAQMQDWARRDGAPAARVYAALAAAERRAGGPAVAARAAFEAALEEAERERVPIDLMRVGRSYVDWLMQQRDYPRASVVAEGLAGWTGRDYDAALLQLRIFHALRNPAAWPAALQRASALAGERAIPAELTRPPRI